MYAIHITETEAKIDNSNSVADPVGSLGGGGAVLYSLK